MRRPAHAVHEQEHLLAGGNAQVGQDGFQEAVGDAVGVFHRDPVPSGLPVDPDADFDFVLFQVKAGHPCVRDRTGGQRDAHAADVLVDPVPDGGDSIQVIPAFGSRTGDLLHQDGTAHAAPTCRVQRVLHGDVVVHQYGADLHAFGLRHFGGRFEIQDVARVVLDDVDDAGTRVYGERRGNDLIRRGRSEDRTRHRGVKHSQPDEPAVKRFVAAAAAADKAHFPGHGGVLPGNEFRLGAHGHNVRMRKAEAFHGLVYYSAGIVDQLLHWSAPWSDLAALS
ncbi:hypothetical protein D9M72_503990 [compost metagenome]